MNEAETRAEHIDPALKAAGWGVVEGSRILREYPITLGRIEGHGKRAKADVADYVLIYRNHKLAVVEAYWGSLSDLLYKHPRFSLKVHPYIRDGNNPEVGLEGKVKSDEELAELKRLVAGSKPPVPVHWDVRVDR